MTEPLPHPTFAWNHDPDGSVLWCRPLAAHAQHLFTARHRPDAPPDRGDPWSHVSRALGVPDERVVRLTQVHGARVVAIPDEAGTRREDGTWADADAAVTDRPDLVLAVKVADCLPILIADTASSAVAAVHAGWRGTAAGVAAATVRRMADRYGLSPATFVVAIGPGIGPCCLQVGTEVADRFLEAGTDPASVAEWFSVAPGGPPDRRAAETLSRGSVGTPRLGAAGTLGLGSVGTPGLGAAGTLGLGSVGTPGLGVAGTRGRGPGGMTGAGLVPGKLWLDAWKANADQLMASGVTAANIHVAGLCTACHPEWLHSYRVAGPRAGRMIGAIRTAGTAPPGE